jgi:glucose/arabinose dehydrogenase
MERERGRRRRSGWRSSRDTWPMRSPTPARRGIRSRRATSALAAVAVVVALSGCGGEEAREPGSPTSTTARRSTSPTSRRGETQPAPSADLAAPVTLVDLELGLDAPIAADAVPGSTSLVVAERAGRLHEVVLADGEARLGEEPLLDLVDLVGSTASERGLLGVAVAPDASFLVVSYTASEDGANQIDRYLLEGEPGALRIDAASRTELLRVAQPYPNHNGGHVTFGPDGLLYAGLGDGGSGGDPEGNGQDRATLLGKILRLDPRPGAALVPSDNPFVDAQDGSRPEIWLTGVRNPWRFSFDRATGDLWIADVGQNAWEEIDRLPASEGAGRGANLGWDLFEGTEEFDDADPAGNGWSDGPFVEPLHTYGRDEGCSITGGVVHDGATVPSLAGAYLFADYCGAGVRALVPGDGRAEVAELDGAAVDEVVGFAEGPGGEVLVISLADGLFELRPR